MKQKELDKEGITKDYLSTLNVKKLGNPVQLLPNDEPVNLVKCTKGFWVSIDGNLIKDKANEYLVISDKEAKVGRARYLLNFSKEIFEYKIAREILRLKSIVDKELSKQLKIFHQILMYSGHIKDGFSEVIFSHFANEDHNKEKRELALKIVDDNFLSLHKKLLEQDKLGSEKDYNSLYAFLIQKNSYEIASFDITNEKQMSSLIRNFHRDEISNTIMEIQSSEHLFNIAKFNIDKQK